MNWIQLSESHVLYEYGWRLETRYKGDIYKHCMIAQLARGEFLATVNNAKLGIYKSMKGAKAALERVIIGTYFRYEWDEMDSCYHIWFTTTSVPTKLHRYEATPHTKAKALAKAKKDFLAEL